MSLELKLIALATAVGTDVGDINQNIGTLANLTTTQKANLVAAINEVKAAVSAVDLTAIINDAAGAGVVDKTWSADKIVTSLNTLKAEIIDGAPAAYDTLQEISAYLATNDTAQAALLEALGKRVRYDAAQTLTTAEQLQACTNIGVGDPEVDLVASYETAKAA